MVEIEIEELTFVNSADYELAKEFFSLVLDIDIDEALVNEDATLSDFTFAGTPDGVVLEEDSYETATEKWDHWVHSEICHRYDIEPFNIEIRIQALLELIKKRKAARIH